MAVCTLGGCPQLCNFTLVNVVEWAFSFPFCFEASDAFITKLTQQFISVISSILQTPINENIHNTQNELLMSQAQNPPYGRDHEETLVQKEQTRLFKI